MPAIRYVSPSIWAWRSGRLAKIARSVSHMLAFVSFEPEIYRRQRIPLVWLRRPSFADMIPARGRSRGRQGAARRQQGSGGRCSPCCRAAGPVRVASTRGSLVETAQRLLNRFPDSVFLVPLVSRETRLMFEGRSGGRAPRTCLSSCCSAMRGEALAACDAALVASGTATLEAALLKAPMVIAYRLAPLSWQLMRRMRLQPWIGLPNILAGRFVVPEFLQDDASADNRPGAGQPGRRRSGQGGDGTRLCLAASAVAQRHRRKRPRRPSRRISRPDDLRRERGRAWALAGPVVAAAVILDIERPIAGLADSKKLSARAGNGLAAAIRERAIAWAVAEASVEIDHLNILRATMLAMKRAIEGFAPATDAGPGGWQPLPRYRPAGAGHHRRRCQRSRDLGGVDSCKTCRDAGMLQLHQLSAIWFRSSHGLARPFISMPCAATGRRRAIDAASPGSPTAEISALIAPTGVATGDGFGIMRIEIHSWRRGTFGQDNHISRQCRHQGLAGLGQGLARNQAPGPHADRRPAFAGMLSAADRLSGADRRQRIRIRQTRIAGLLADCPGAEVMTVADGLFRDLSGVATPVGILGVIDVPPTPDDDIRGRCVMLDAVQDAGNVGAILRTAAAAGIGDVVLGPGCAGAWTPRVLRAAQARISVSDCERTARSKPWSGDFAAKAAMAGQGESLFGLNLSGDIAWIFGNEGSGIAPGLAGLATRRVTIPFGEQHGSP